MLNKFQAPNQELPPNDPRLKLMDTWAAADGIFRANGRSLSRLIGQVENESSNSNPGQDYNYAVELEKKLQTSMPDFCVALDGLRAALDGVTGYHIGWRHYRRGEVIGLSEPDIIGNVSVSRTVRAPAEYDENEGFIVGSLVGPDRILGGIAAWVEIGQTRESERGVHFQLGEMHNIELTDQSRA